MIKIDLPRYFGEKCWTRKFMWFGWVWQPWGDAGQKNRWHYFPADRWMIHYTGNHQAWTDD